MKRFLICMVVLIVAAVLATDVQAQVLRRRGGGCNAGGCGVGSSGCNVGSSGCNVGSSQGCNISSAPVQAARAADLIQQPVLPPPATSAAIVPDVFRQRSKAYSRESVIAFTRPVETPSKPGPSGRLIAAR